MPDGQSELNGHGGEPLVVDAETEKFLREMRVRRTAVVRQYKCSRQCRTRSYVCTCGDGLPSLRDAAWACMCLNMMCVLQPPNTPVSIKTGNTLLSVIKAEAGPNADGCIAPGSVWISSGPLNLAHQDVRTRKLLSTGRDARDCAAQTRTAAACTWLGTRGRAS